MSLGTLPTQTLWPNMDVDTTEQNGGQNDDANLLDMFARTATALMHPTTTANTTHGTDSPPESEVITNGKSEKCVTPTTETPPATATPPPQPTILVKRGRGRPPGSKKSTVLAELAVPAPRATLMPNKRPSISSDKTGRTSGVGSENSICGTHNAEPTVVSCVMPRPAGVKRRKRSETVSPFAAADRAIVYPSVTVSKSTKSGGKKLGFMTQIQHQQQLLEKKKAAAKLAGSMAQCGVPPRKNSVPDERESADVLLLLCTARDTSRDSTTPSRPNINGHRGGFPVDEYAEGGEVVRVRCHLCAIWAREPCVDKKGFMYCFSCLKNYVKRTSKSPEGGYMSTCDIVPLRARGTTALNGDDDLNILKVLRQSNAPLKSIFRYGNEVYNVMDEVKDLLDANVDTFSTDFDPEDSWNAIASEQDDDEDSNPASRSAVQRRLLETLRDATQAKVVAFTSRLNTIIDANTNTGMQ